MNGFDGLEAEKQVGWLIGWSVGRRVKFPRARIIIISSSILIISITLILIINLIFIYSLITSKIIYSFILYLFF